MACSLYKKILELKQSIAQLTSNETLDAFDLEFCKLIDSGSIDDKFIESRLKKTLRELNLTGGVDYNEHYRSAYESYNEAVTYIALRDKGITIKGIPECKTSTPDFEISVNCSYCGDEPDLKTIYLEVKTLGFAMGNLIYKQSQSDSLDCQIRIEEQHRKGKRMCMAERSVAPLGYVGFVKEVECIIQKIDQNIKSDQFSFGDGKSTLLFVDLNQLWYSRQMEDCLPVYPDLAHNCCASGKLWLIAFSNIGERVYLKPEFEGKGCFGDELQQQGILNQHTYVKGIIFGLGKTPDEKTFYGFYRSEQEDDPTTVALQKICDFSNDEQNSNGWRYFEDYKKDIGIE